MKYFVLLVIGFTFLIIGANPIYAQYTEHVSDPSLARHHPSWVLGSNDMNYSQFLDFCDNYDSALSDSMSTKERMISNLCDFRDKGFDEKQWNWLNGTKLDWKNFAQNKTEEYATNIPIYKEHGVKGSLVVKSVVSLRESFPPPMSATISFDYMSGSEIKQYKKEFMVGIPGLSERTDNILPQKTENFIGNDLVPPSILSPLQQFKAEMRDNIQCRSGLELLRKASDGFPTCVKPQTKTELLKRGWGSDTWPFKSVIKMDNSSIICAQNGGHWLEQYKECGSK